MSAQTPQSPNSSPQTDPQPRLLSDVPLCLDLHDTQNCIRAIALIEQITVTFLQRIADDLEANPPDSTSDKPNISTNSNVAQPPPARPEPRRGAARLADSPPPNTNTLTPTKSPPGPSPNQSTAKPQHHRSHRSYRSHPTDPTNPTDSCAEASAKEHPSRSPALSSVEGSHPPTPPQIPGIPFSLHPSSFSLQALSLTIQRCVATRHKLIALQLTQLRLEKLKTELADFATDSNATADSSTPTTGFGYTRADYAALADKFDGPANPDNTPPRPPSPNSPAPSPESPCKSVSACREPGRTVPDRPCEPGLSLVEGSVPLPNPYFIPPTEDKKPP